MKDFKQILDAVKTVSDNQTVQIFVPSDGSKKIFRLLTAKQQKDLIKTVTEKNISPILFIENINSIIATNSVEKYNFSISDRTYIAAMLRAYSISKDFTSNSITVDLTILQDNNIKLDETVCQKTIESSELKINCKIPSLKEDSAYNTALIDVSKNKSTAEVLGEIFIYEVSKYITCIESIPLNFNIKLDDMNIKQRCQLVENLPAKVYNEVIDYINQVRAQENKNFTVNGKIIDIDLDQSFFTA